MITKIALDMDNTLCDRASWPHIGKLREDWRVWLKMFHELGAEIWIYTCRTNPAACENANEQIVNLKQWIIDQQLSEYITGVYVGPGKMNADFFIDDKSVEFPGAKF